MKGNGKSDFKLVPLEVKHRKISQDHLGCDTM
jgi:hypothetical protein